MKLFRTWFFSAMLVTCSLCKAQSTLDSLQHIQEVVVVADQVKSVMPAQTLRGEQLERLSSFSVADAIRYFSGVQLKDYGGIGGLKTIDIRSMGSHHMGVFYDGIQLGNAQNGQIDLGKFSLDNIEEISLYNGQKSEVFQSAKDFGSAGTIYLKTRKPRFEVNKNFNLVTTYRTGSFGLVNPSILWEKKLWENTSYSFSAESIAATGQYPFRYRKVFQDGTVAWDTTAIRENGDVRSVRLEQGFNGYFEAGSWHVKAYFYDSEKGIPGAIVNNIWKRSQRQWDRNIFVQGSVQKSISTKYDVLIQAKYANDWMRYLNPDTTLMYIDNDFLQQEIYVSIANMYSIRSNWTLNLSCDYQWNTLDASLKNFVQPERNTLLLALASHLEWKRFKAQASLLGTYVFESVHQGAKPEDTKEYTPAVFVTYRPSAGCDLEVQGFYKRVFRMPTFNDLYYTDIGNIALKPEYTNQFNLGLNYESNTQSALLSAYSFRIDTYYNKVTDKIVAIPKGNGQYRWMMMNLGLVEIRGVDVSTAFRWILPEGMMLNTSVNYTYQKAQDFSYPLDNDPVSGSYGGQIAYIPWHNTSAIVQWNWRTLDVNYSFIYVGERYHNSSNIPANYEQPWYTHDLTIGKRLRFWRVKGRLSTEINNLFNQYYDVVLNYPMPGRNYKLILKVEI